MVKPLLNPLLSNKSYDQADMSTVPRSSVFKKSSHNSSSHKMESTEGVRSVSEGLDLRLGKGPGRD
jgi:hypothetical protein